MTHRIAFQLRAARLVAIVTLLLCIAIPVYAQHGGGGHGGGFGGGHFGGGHLGGGHSSAHSASHAGGHHFGFLHFGSKNRSGRGGSGYAAGRYTPPELLDGGRSAVPLPSTHIRTFPLHTSTVVAGKGTEASFRFHRGVHSRRFLRIHPSGCFFNGFNQVCFFEPGFSLFFFGSGYDWCFPFLDFSCYNAIGDPGGDDLGGTDTVSSATSGDPVSTSPASPPTHPASDSSAPRFSNQGLGDRLFLLVLKNGANQPVKNYWLSNGYIEYVTDDGGRSHIPTEALDLEQTVSQNSARGLPFVLRSEPQ
ncbi:MAG TPA: hypothetical protein VFO39_01030 [Candidatus Sulfotelmatobacter sp.]|nr:hypothetical protein [Candidatus Sulfotelmatobacter sp.]